MVIQLKRCLVFPVYDNDLARSLLLVRLQAGALRFLQINKRRRHSLDPGPCIEYPSHGFSFFTATNPDIPFPRARRTVYP